MNAPEPYVIVALLLATVVVAAVIIAAVVSRRHRRAREASAGTSLLQGTRRPVAEIVWLTRQAWDRPAAADLTGITAPHEVGRLVSRSFESMDADEGDRIRQLQDRMERTQAARVALLGAAATLPTQYSVVAADSIVVALGDVLTEAPAAEMVGALGGAIVTVGVDDHLDGIPFVGDIPAVDGMVEAMGHGVAEHLASGLGALGDSVVPIPVFTAATAMLTARRSLQNGLERGRVAENVGWDVGVKGGALAVGAALGQILIPIPGVGAVIGGAAAGVAGQAAASFGKERHLRQAVERLSADLQEVGGKVERRHLAQIERRSSYQIDDMRKARQSLADEFESISAARTWWSRTFKPSVGLLICARSIELADADIEVQSRVHAKLVHALRDCAPRERGAMWALAHHHFDTVFDGPSIDAARTSMTGLMAERRRLGLATA